MESGQRCVVCLKTISGIASSINPTENENSSFYYSSSTEFGKGDCSSLRRQLPVVFLLQKFLDIPKELCCQFLEEKGNPFTWVQWCSSCSVLIKNAETCFLEIALLQRQFDNYKIELRNIICHSEEAMMMDPNMLNSEFENSTANELINIVRSNITKGYSFPSAPKIKEEFENDYKDFNFIDSTEYNEDDYIEDTGELNEIPLSVAKGRNRKAKRTHFDNSYELEKDNDANDEACVSDKVVTFRCRVCPKKFKTKYSLRMHKERRHIAPEDRPHGCEICGKRFVELSYLKRHVSFHTDNLAHSCESCGKTFKHMSTLIRHKKKQECGVVRQCTMCPENFTQSTQLAKHFLAVHYDDNKKKSENLQCLCPVCGETISRYHDLPRHLTTHSDERPHLCPKCGKGFKHSLDVSAHLRNMHSDIKFKCSICGKEFKTKSQAELHEIRIHNSETRERSFVCHFCGKAYFNKSCLAEHLLTHAPQKSISCTLCDYKCSTPRSLKQHLLTHTGERPYSCTFCGKGFRTSGNLKLHRRVHTGEKPYSCTVCGKGFPAPKNLQLHLRVHTGEKPYSCNFCDKTFAARSNLNKHSKTHAHNP